jgi:hypothetical protein
MDRQTLILFLCFFVHAMLISVTSKVQCKTKTFILYPVIIMNIVRSFMLSDTTPSTAPSFVLFLVFVEAYYIRYIVKRMEKFSDTTHIIILVILFSMICADLMYVSLEMFKLEGTRMNF